MFRAYGRWRSPGVCLRSAARRQALGDDTTNAVESLNARFRRAVRHRGHFPTEQAALKVLYLVATQKRKNRQDMTGTINGWKTILNTLHVHYGDRIQASINQ